MSLISKTTLSGSTNGQSIAVQAADTTLHVTDAAKTEQITLVVSNVDASTAYTLTLKEGTTTVLVKEIEAGNGEEIVYNNLIAGAAVTLKAITTVANKLYIRGDINQEG